MKTHQNYKKYVEYIFSLLYTNRHFNPLYKTIKVFWTWSIHRSNQLKMIYYFEIYCYRIVMIYNYVYLLMVLFENLHTSNAIGLYIHSMPVLFCKPTVCIYSKHNTSLSFFSKTWKIITWIKLLILLSLRFYDEFSMLPSR